MLIILAIPNHHRLLEVQGLNDLEQLAFPAAQRCVLPRQEDELPEISVDVASPEDR